MTGLPGATAAPAVVDAAADRAGLRLRSVRTVGLGVFDAFACRFERP